MSNGLTSVDAIGKRYSGDAAPDAGVPILGVADTTTPAAVDDGDAVLVLTDLYGRLKVVIDSVPVAIPVVATGDVCISDIISFASVAGQTSMANSFPVVLSSDYTPTFATAADVCIANIISFVSVAGQSPMANSFPVVIASDQSTIPIIVADITNISTIAGQKTMAASFPVVLPSDQSVSSIVVGDISVADVLGFATVKGQKTSAESFPVVLSSDSTYNLGTIDVPTASPSVSNIIIAAPDTEYSLAFPNNCRRAEFQCRESADVLYAFTTGNVSWPTDPYMTLKSGGSYDPGRIYQALAPSTLYLASDYTGATVEVLTWT